MEEHSGRAGTQRRGRWKNRPGVPAREYCFVERKSTNFTGRIKLRCRDKRISERVESVQNFCENLKEYRKYIELEQGLEQFNNEAVGTIYVVISDEDEEKSVGNVSYVKEDKWIAARNDAFYALESGVSLLPNEPVGTEAEESTVDNKITEIPSEAIRLQKLLFAELTDVERAINYFEKEYTGYREMAVFSVVMAVFFDLGAFISGNLVMLIEYFIKESPKDNDSAHSQQDKNQEKEMAQIH